MKLMFVNTRNRILLKHLAAVIRVQDHSPARLSQSGVSRAEYEDYLLQKFFFKNGGIYFKVFKDPNELHQEINRAIESGLIAVDEGGFLSVAPAGQKYARLVYGLGQSAYLIILVAIIAVVGFGVGVGINYALALTR